MKAEHLKILLVLSVLILLLMVFYLKMETNQVSAFEINDKLIEKQPEKRHVFFDLGTNNGDSVKYFIDEAVRSEKDVLKGYGYLNQVSWEIYAIEANPYFNGMLSDVKKYSENRGHTFNLLTETAAWVKNEKLVFYLDTINVKHNFWGSSLSKLHPDVVNSGYKNVTVQGVDVSELLKKYNSNDEIIMKIDIEGTEFDLLLHLIKEGTLHLVDIIAIEFHQRLYSDTKFPASDLINFFNQYFKFYGMRSVPWY